MSMLKRINEDILVNIFRSAAAGKNRIPLRRAFSEFVRIFYGDGVNVASRSAEFLNEFYLRGIDVRCGLRSQVLMVGGPKNLRGNPRGGLDARLFYPSITCEQFISIARAMESVILERQVPHLTGGCLKAERRTVELDAINRKQHRELLSSVQKFMQRD
uniref:Uncharacterized protein n=1 Tax=Babesia bovis TaxID=5865 RepID=S6B0M6_BABBO|nr:hypothetical protein [Babesia bovis]